MKRVDLDFAPRSWAHGLGRARLWQWGMAVLLLAACLAACVQWLALEKAGQKVQVELAALQQTAPRANTAKKPTASPVSPEQKKALNHAILQLNQPWPTLFDALERTATSQIAVLDVNFDAGGQRLRGTAEARNFKSMMAFLGRLDAGPTFHAAQLTSHQTEEADPNAPIRFKFSADWQGSTP